MRERRESSFTSSTDRIRDSCSSSNSCFHWGLHIGAGPQFLVPKRPQRRRTKHAASFSHAPNNGKHNPTSVLEVPSSIISRAAYVERYFQSRPKVPWSEAKGRSLIPSETGCTASGPLSARHPQATEQRCRRFPDQSRHERVNISGFSKIKRMRQLVTGAEGGGEVIGQVNERGWTSTMNVDRLQETDRIQGWCRIS
uniref:uncharacterized protein LOC117608400 n=1 Tax=Osmia lignaria TaxID=473952 RepID=UPI001478A716|nr:uncharacterized protein LOC117608400 [Osmia lignaria]